MPSSKRQKSTKKLSNTGSFYSLNAKRADNILAMMSETHTTSALHQLEYYRQNLSVSAFRSLLLLLTTKLNSTDWTKFVDHQEWQVVQRKRPKPNRHWVISSRDQIDHCCCIILYYIVSVIHKYQIPSVENLWNEILGNSLTQNYQFYHYLHKNKIIIPNETLKIFSDKFSGFYARQSSKNRIKFIELGFIFDGMITAQTSIKHIEKIFSQLKQREKSGGNIIEPEKLIPCMNTPEKLSLFLSHFPDYDINQVNQQNQFNVLEQLINMKPYFYLSSIDTSNSIGQNLPRRHRFTFTTLISTPTLQLVSHPNEIVKYRAVRIINLLQQLIYRGARLSKPIYSSNLFEGSKFRFFSTSIGIYVFLGLNINDLYMNTSPATCDAYFMPFIIENIKRFEPEFREFILHYLTISHSIIHKPKFILERRKTENEQEQQMNDELFQRTIKLKEWCRLKIKDNCSQKYIKELDLPKRLVNYCSFGFTDSNYALQCITEVARYNGKIPPRRTLPENAINMQVDTENDDHDGEMVIDVNSDGNQSDNSEMSVNDNA